MISNQEILTASILIVDDQPANVLLLSELLRDAGYTSIASTTDPYAVSELHRNNRFDLILLDLQMPGMDGFEVMEQLKTIDANSYLPVLVITAQPDHKLRALASGAKDFVAKPFDLIEVRTRIRNMLEVRLLHKRLGEYNELLEQTVQARTEALHASEARFRRLTELSSDWYWEQDENGSFTRIFGPALEMLGIRIDDKLGNIRDDYGLSWIDSEREMLSAKLAGRQPFLDFVYSRINSGGPHHYQMVSGEPMFDSSGKYTGYRGIGKDVTDTMQPVLASAQNDG
jgi:PAS domain S-box-containing protein